MQLAEVCCDVRLTDPPIEGFVNCYLPGIATALKDPTASLIALFGPICLLASTALGCDQCECMVELGCYISYFLSRYQVSERCLSVNIQNFDMRNAKHEIIICNFQNIFRTEMLSKTSPASTTHPINWKIASIILLGIITKNIF